MQENQEKTSNNLIVGVDWLSFTVHDDTFSPEILIDFMGFSRHNFRNMPNGANGYKRMMKFQDISILYDGAENMGIHINITGSSVATVLDAYKKTLIVETPFGNAYDLWEETILARFLRELLKIGHITRIDLAIDDFGCKYYNIDEIIKKQASGKILSKWRSSRKFLESTVAENSKVGQTIYFGSPQSEIMMRIYDKKLEQNKSLEVNDENYIHEDWVRWELELHKERANEVCRLLSNGQALGKVAIGVLSYYFRIIKLDDSNKSRCSNELKWQKFIDNVSQLRITVKKEQKTLDEELKQWEHQNGRKVAKFFEYMGGDLGYFGELACRNYHKLTPHDKEQLGIIETDY